MTLKLHSSAADRGVEPLPMRGLEMLGNDEVDAVADSLLRRETKQQGGRPIPSHDHSGTIGADQGIRNSLDNLRVQIRFLLHSIALYLPVSTEVTGLVKHQYGTIVDRWSRVLHRSRV